MSIMNLSIRGKQYQIACGDGQEAHLNMLAGQLNERLTQIAGTNTRLPDSTLMLLGALMIADELHELQGEHQKLYDYMEQVESQNERYKSNAQDANADALTTHRETMENEFSGIISTLSEKLEKMVQRTNKATAA